MPSPPYFCNFVVFYLCWCMLGSSAEWLCSCCLWRLYCQCSIFKVSFINICSTRQNIMHYKCIWILQKLLKNGRLNTVTYTSICDSKFINRYHIY